MMCPLQLFHAIVQSLIHALVPDLDMMRAAMDEHGLDEP